MGWTTAKLKSRINIVDIRENFYVLAIKRWFSVTRYRMGQVGYCCKFNNLGISYLFITLNREVMPACSLLGYI